MEVFGSESLDHKVERNKNDKKKNIIPSWWFQPIWKILVNMGIFHK